MLPIYSKNAVLPACAGVILVVDDFEEFTGGFTRMRGGDPDSLNQQLEQQKFYPHARG